jgi:hypothetical protein
MPERKYCLPRPRSVPTVARMFMTTPIICAIVLASHGSISSHVTSAESFNWRHRVCLSCESMETEQTRNKRESRSYLRRQRISDKNDVRDESPCCFARPSSMLRLRGGSSFWGSPQQQQQQQQQQQPQQQQQQQGGQNLFGTGSPIINQQVYLQN